MILKNKKNFIWNSIGLTFNAFNSLFFLIIVNRINGENIGGIFTYAFSLCMLSYVVSNYFNRAYQIANYNNEKVFNDFLTARIIFTIFSIIVTVIFCFANSFSMQKKIIIILLLLYRMIESISDCFYGLFQSKNDLYKSGISYSLKSILSLLSFFIIDFITKNIFLSIISIIISYLLIFITYDLINSFKYLKEKIYISFEKFKKITFEAFPIFIFTFFSIYLSNQSKYILTYFAKNNIQNIFGIIIMPATMISLIGSYIIMPFLNNFKELYESKNHKKLLNKSNSILIIILALDILVISACLLIGIPALNFVFNINLSKYKLLFAIILLGAYFNTSCMVISNVLVIEKKNKIQLLNYFITTIVSTIVSIYFIKFYGVKGASYAYLISYIILFILFYTYFYTINKGEKK